MATSVDEVRHVALGLPEAVEQDHHGFPSFRVRGRIFATLPDSLHLNVMIDIDEVDAAVGEAPSCCEPLWAGKKLRGVRIDLATAEPDFVGDLLRDAWAERRHLV